MPAWKNEDYRIRQKQCNRRRYREKRDWLNTYKSNKGCARCGERDFRCLDLHHIDPATKGTKTPLGNYVRLQSTGWDQLMSEVLLCEVLCANCHRKETWDLMHDEGSDEPVHIYPATVDMASIGGRRPVEKTMNACAGCGAAFPRWRNNGKHTGPFCSRECYDAWRGSPEQLFWSKLQHEPGDGCWNWTRTVGNTGRGLVGYKGKTVLAHRLAYELTFGKIQPGMFVLHRCHNGLCCRPDHLFLGTQRSKRLPGKIIKYETPKRAVRPVLQYDVLTESDWGSLPH